MINDKGFVDAYAAIYEKKENKDEKRWQDDDGDGKWYEKSDVDGKISKREKDEKKSKKKDDEDEDKKEEANEEVVNEWGSLVAKVGAKGAALGAKAIAKRGGAAAVKKAAISGAKHGAINAGINAVAGGGGVDESVKIEDAEGNVTAEVIDLVTPEPIKSVATKEETEMEHDELLEERLWDQVAANLTTLGEMGGVRYKVIPADEAEVEEKVEEGVINAVKGAAWGAKRGGVKGALVGGAVGSRISGKIGGKKKKVKEETEVDIDAAMQQQSPFNVKSPVIFSNKKEVVEEEKEDLTSKYAPNIIKADALQKEAVGEIAGTVAGSAAGSAIAGPVGGFVGGMAGGALGSKLDKKRKERKAAATAK